ncbi:MAG: STAS domain-containing protein [Candidatus Tritonobacter lacicola]|nr:STAS domain-containing protein [Candidatus Tritonobacter lacicola]
MKRKILGMMGKLEVVVREESGVGIIEASGEIDVYNSGEIKKLVDAYIARGTSNILLDMRGVDYLDSSTISVLLVERERLTSHGGRLKLLGLQENPRKVFEIAKIDSIFDIYDNEEEALRSFAEKKDY